MDIGALKAVKVDRDEGLTWVTLNRPEKRNAMSPEMHFEMDEVLAFLESDPATKCVVITGAGSAFCAGQDMQKFFRETTGEAEFKKVSEAANRWRWERLYMYDKPTIAMVNGACVGGAFMQLVACDFAIAAEDAMFSLSEVNWGGLPGALVTRAVVEAVGYRDAIELCCTGRPISGTEAARMRLVNRAVPADRLRSETIEWARLLMSKDPAAISGAKKAVRLVRNMDFTQAYSYLAAMSAMTLARNAGGGRAEGIKQFLDDKQYKPALESYDHQRRP